MRRLALAAALDCAGPDEDRWREVRQRLHAHAPKLDGRRAYLAFPDDIKLLEFLEDHQRAFAAPDGCAVGQLAVRLAHLAFKPPSEEELQPRYDELEELPGGWPELLVSEWPLFHVLGYLHAGLAPEAEASRGLWAALQAQAELPELPAQHCEAQCTWVEHPRQFLPDYADDSMYPALEPALQACQTHPKCKGVTQEIHEGAEGQEQWFTMRRGWPPQESPAGESSFVFTCDNTECAAEECARLLVEAERSLRGGAGAGGYRPEILFEAQRKLRLAGPALRTHWPVFGLLRRIQGLLRLRLKPGASTGERLRHVLGFSDEQWGLLGDELAQMERMPDHFIEAVQCSNGFECAKELGARTHVHFFRNEVLPRGDPVLIGAKDYLAKVYMQKEKWFTRGDDDWQHGLKSTVDLNGFRVGDPADVPEDLVDEIIPDGQALVVDRRQAAAFMVFARGIIEERTQAGRHRNLLGRCIEWDNPFYTVKVFGDLCSFTDIFSYAEPDEDFPEKGHPGMREYPRGLRHYWGDIVDLQGTVEERTFELVVATFVWEHVHDPFRAIEELYKITAPGGWVIWGAPMFAQFHGIPSDYQRYTPSGLDVLAKRAGFELAAIYSPGDIKLMLGVLQGLMSPYWTHAEMLTDYNGAHPLNVFGLLRRPEVDVV